MKQQSMKDWWNELGRKKLTLDWIEQDGIEEYHKVDSASFCHSIVHSVVEALILFLD